MTKQHKPKNKANNKTKSRFCKVLIILLSIPVAIGLLAALVVGSINLSAAIKKQAAIETLTRETSEARATQEPLEDSAHQEKIDLLNRLGVVDTAQKAYSKKVDTCSLVGTQAGWTYTGWQQRCFFMYTNLLPTSLSREEVIAKLSGNTEATELFGKPVTRRYAQTCDFFEKNYSSTLRYYDPLTSTEPAKKGCYPDFTQTNTTTFDIEGVHNIRTFSNEDIDQSKPYIEVTSRSEYYVSAKLGCKSMSFMCSPPLDSPVPAFK